jgi:hypothetical protein
MTGLVTAHRNGTQKNQIFYVESLPGQGGKDYGYTEDPKKAAPLTVRQAKAFLVYCECVSARGFGTSPYRPE